MTANKDSLDEIAVIGMTGRFPGARTLEQFWYNLRSGIESISFFSDEEILASGIRADYLSDPHYVKAGAIVDDIDLFDAGFFGFAPREAEITDPQHRLFLECAWESLERAGYTPEACQGRVGVYAAVSTNTYLLTQLLSNSSAIQSSSNFQTLTGNEKDYLATRVSYKLNLRGPSMTVQTACSSSLVAVHLAAESLLRGECDMALAGGVKILVPQKSGYLYQEGGIWSPDGHCRPFDANAQGTIFGSGVGVVVLKRVGDALADGDSIHAVIKGSAVNNDGSRKVGFTAPSVEGQAEVVEEALGIADIEPASITYIEAHGTGTPLGDPIEITALTRAFRRRLSKPGSCAVGSVKSNIGHLEVAAGIAGLIKTILALKHKQLPPSLHFREPNPEIEFDKTPFYVNATLSEWKNGGTPRRAGVSSFGIGGTNAHLILEEAPAPIGSASSRTKHLLLLSAKSSAALEAATANLTDYFKDSPEANLADVSSTLQTGRKTFSHRRFALCGDVGEALNILEEKDSKRLLSHIQEQTNRPLVFMFSGQGSQYSGMAAGLYRSERVFREQVDICGGLLGPHLGSDIKEILLAGDGRDSERLDQTAITQPALFVVEYALARQLMAYGVQPKAMIGHSVGEYVAACLASVLTLEEALAIIAFRGRIIQSLPAGAMLAVQLTKEEARAYLSDGLALAAVNGSSTCVLSGPIEAVERLQLELTQKGVGARRLQTSHAFHSAMMEPAVRPFLEFVRRYHLKPPKMPYISNVTGSWITTANATDPAYWARHIRETVRFADGVTELMKNPDHVYLEVGPGQALAQLVRKQFAAASPRPVFSAIRTPQEQVEDEEFLLNTLGKLWLTGAQIEWKKFYAGERRQKMPLPTYPFQRQRYWVERARERDGQHSELASLRRRPGIDDWFYIPVWKPSLKPIRHDSVARSEEQLSWLLFCDELGLGNRLAARLEESGHAVIRVIKGDRFLRASENAFIINPLEGEDYGQMVGELKAAGKFPEKIIHLWSVSVEPQTMDGYLADGFFSLLFLAKAIGKNKIASDIRIEAVSSQMQIVGGEALLVPEKATLLGACRVIPQEYSNTSCRSIDVAAQPAGASLDEKLIDQLIAEAFDESSDSVVAYRGAQRWTQTFEAVQLPATNSDLSQIKTDGVYLITGGLGGIGLTLAGYLARRAKAKLILTGRSSFPDQSEWDGWLATHAEKDGVSATIRELRAIEEIGAEVLVCKADVTDLEQMRSVFTTAKERFGKINGFIHAAGIAGGGLIDRESREHLLAIMAPKLLGARVLEELIGNDAADFIAYCSSTIAVTGGIGQVGYCGANVFLDSFAVYNQMQRGVVTLSINWDAWQQVGMATSRAALLKDDTTSPRQKTNEHPLLSYCLRESPTRSVYVTEFAVSKHWLLDEHRILGKPALPGAAFIELAAAAFGDLSPSEAVELSDMFFISTLVVDESAGKEVHTILEKDGETYRFSIASSSDSEHTARTSFTEYATGKINAFSAPPPEPGRIQDIIARCTEVEAFTEQAASSNRSEAVVKHGQRWRSIKKLLRGADEALAMLELPQACADDIQQYKYHPALFDIATGFAISLVAPASYMPLSYSRVVLMRPLPRSIYSHARWQGGPGAQGETFTVDVTIFDLQGQELIRVEGFTLKRVTASALDSIEPTPQSPALDKAPAGALRSRGDEGYILPKEGQEVFGRLLIKSIFPQVAVTSRDLHELIEKANSFARSHIVLDAQDGFTTPQSYERPDISTPYVEPRTDLERLLAGIWQSALGIEKVGINDNFFELGGDSILAIQVLAKTNKVGFRFTPNQLFQNQTIAEVAALASAAPAPPAAAGHAAGSEPPVAANFSLAKLDRSELESVLSSLNKRKE